MSIDYSDGERTEAAILEAVNRAVDLRSTTVFAGDRDCDWATEYHLCPERSNLLRHLEFSGLDVLELGAGMGGVSRVLAEKARHLTVVEGTQARYGALVSRLRDLDNWDGVVANIQDIGLTRKYDVVCLVGVLEYAELYIAPDADSDASPFAACVRAARRFLRDDGVLVLAIENQLGLKYWSGASEDHSGRLFDGICGYPAGKSAKTFSRRVLLALLETCGFRGVQEYFPFPDYKIPASVVTRELIEAAPGVAGDLATHQPFRDYTGDRVICFPDALAIREVAAAGLLPDLSNSFLMVAAATASSPTLRRVCSATGDRGELGWHYSNRRRVPALTVFYGTPLHTRKTPLLPEHAGVPVILECDGMRFRWVPSSAEPLTTDEPLKVALHRCAYFEEWTEWGALLERFLVWSRSQWQGDAANLDGRAIDAQVNNVALARGNGWAFKFYDLEWELEGRLPLSWFVLRNLLALNRETAWYAQSCPHKSLADAYAYCCLRLGVPGSLESDIQREAAFHHAVIAEPATSRIAEEISRAVSWPIGRKKLPRMPGIETRIQSDFRGASAPPSYSVYRLAQWMDRLASPLKRIETLRRISQKMRNRP